MITQDREYRAFSFSAPDGESKIIEGYAVVFDTPSHRMRHPVLGDLHEVIRRGAIGPHTTMDDVVLTINHIGTPIARTKNQTLELRVDDTGLFVRADLSGSERARQTYEEIRQGLLDKMSFAFTTAKPDGAQYDRRSRMRSVQRIDRLYDVAIVTVPAYEQTEVYARSIFEVEAENANAEARRRARRLSILAKI